MRTEDPTDPPRNPDSLPDSSDPSGPCPRCGRPSNFELRSYGDVTYHPTLMVSGRTGNERVPIERVVVLECSYCRQGIVVVEEERTGGIRGGNSGRITWHGIHWWPTPGSGTLGPEVSTAVAEAYAEGTRALSAAAPNGAVAMFRTAITYMVNDRGSAAAQARPDLKEKIKQMIVDGGPMASLGPWADHVRLYGNAGAHPDLFGDVSVDEAAEVGRLVATMIEMLYVLPATIAKRQAERKP